MSIDSSVIRHCPVCGSSDESQVFRDANIDPQRLDGFAFASHKVPEFMHHRLIICRVCDLMYASPMPSPSQLHAAYQAASFDSGEEARCASRTYASYLRRIAASLPDRTAALDIGTGEGSFLEELAAAGFDQISGVEPSPAAIAAASSTIRARIRQGLFNADDFANDSFSLITCFQTIEHVPDPLAICRGAHRLLKPGGALFIVCHNRRAMSAKLLGTSSPIFDIEHLQLFSPASSRRLLAEASFADIDIRPIWNRYPLHYWMKLAPIPRSAKAGVLRLLKGTRVGFIPIAIPAGNLLCVGYRRASAS